MLKAYEVTVTPKITLYAGSCVMGEYTATVYAKNSAEAIKKARGDRRLEEGRHGVPATYRAKAKDATE